MFLIGGAGALGKTLIERYYRDNQIVVFSRDEHKHVEVKAQYENVTFQIGDVKDRYSVLHALNEHTPDIIVNAAAIKHVQICEDNPFESVRTNIIGHKILIDCVNSCNHPAEILLYISTDKACKPINVYGMSKAISEKLYIDFAKKQDKVKVITCRYGNVVESTGSVIPFFKKLLEQGETSLPITDTRMTRFTITLNESVDLIEWAFDHPDSHGNIVVPKLQSLRVVDLAKVLGNYYDHKHIDLRLVGIRPGEKLHEEMVSYEESLCTICQGKYFIITNNVVTKEPWSFSSDDNLMDLKDIKKYLEICRVIN